MGLWNRLPQKRKLDFWSARVETYLTTHAFLLLFQIAYTSAIAMFFFWGFYKQFKIDEHPVRQYFISIARGAGFVLNLTTALVILLGARLLITWIRESPLQLILPLDKIFPFFHVVVGYTTAMTVVVHGTFHFVWLIGWSGWTSGVFGFTMSAITGVLLLAVFGVMLFFARQSERRNHFQRFYAVHTCGAVLFYALLIVHGMFYEEPETYKWILGPLLIYIIDRLIRRFLTKSVNQQVDNDSFTLKGHGVMQIRVPKAFHYRAGQYAEIMIPAINKEWHPFTIASAPHEDQMHFFIKSLGDWTNALERILKERLETETPNDGLSIRVRGPYGAPCQHVRSYNRVFLVSGGVGSTPFTSICKHLHHLYTSKDKSAAEGLKNAPPGFDRVNERVMEELGKCYGMEVKTTFSAEVQEELTFKGQNVLNVVSMLRSTQDASESAEVSDETINNTEFNETSVTSGNELFDDEAEQPQVLQNNKASEKTETDRLDTVSELRDRTVETSGDMGISVDTTSDNVLSSSQADGLLKQIGSIMYDMKAPRTDEDDIHRAKSSIPFIYGGSADAVRKKEKRKGKEQMQFVWQRREKVTAFVHSTRVSFFLLLSLILRAMLMNIGFILGSLSINQNSTYEGAQWYIITDTILGLMLTLQVIVALLLEISYMGKSFLATLGRKLDLLILAPTVLSSNVYWLYVLSSESDISRQYVAALYFGILPLLFVLLGWRLYRSVGSKSLLKTEESEKKKTVIPSVDFLWTTPHSGDDEWLREELNSLASGSELRLHRYVTRSSEDEIEAKEEFIKSTHGGRPAWDSILQNMALVTPSNSEIGVFFCGPGPMGSALQKAMSTVEVLSNLRGVYLSSTPKKTLVQDLKLHSARTISLLKQFGSNIRFVYREENFGY